jgi:hypothetical protein
MRLFIIGAIVLIIFGIIASLEAAMALFNVTWYSWFMASFLSFLVDIAFSGVYVGAGGFSVGPRQTV